MTREQKRGRRCSGLCSRRGRRQERRSPRSVPIMDVAEKVAKLLAAHLCILFRGTLMVLGCMQVVTTRAWPLLRDDARPVRDARGFCARACFLCGFTMLQHRSC